MHLHVHGWLLRHICACLYTCFQKEESSLQMNIINQIICRSIGVIAYVLLSGLSPFLGDSDAQTWENVTRAEPITFEEEEVIRRPFINNVTQIRPFMIHPQPYAICL